MAEEPGPATKGVRDKRAVTKPGCQIAVLLAKRKVSMKPTCLLLSKKKKKKGVGGICFHSMLMKH